MSETEKTRRQRPGLVFPIVLVILGVLLLLNNLGVLTGDVWQNLWRFWPVILILWGLDSLLREHNITGATIWGAGGTILLLSNLGLIPANGWGILLQLWPVIFVAIGLDIIIRQRSLWQASLGFLVVLLLLGGVLVFGGFLSGRASAPTKVIEQDLGAAESVDLRLDIGAANVLVDAQSETGHMVRGEFYPSSGENIVSNYEISGNEAELRFESEGVVMFRGTGGGGLGFSWLVKGSPDVTYRLNLNQGVGIQEIDGWELPIEELNSDMGVGMIKVFLPANRQMSGTIDGAVGTTRLVIPANAAAQIQINSGLAPVIVPPGYTKTGNTYTSPAYESAEARLQLVVSQAIGLVVVEESVER